MASQFLLKLRQISTATQISRDRWASPDKCVSLILPARALPRTWRSDRADRIKISLKMAYNCSSNYGNFPTQRNGLIFFKFFAINSTSPDKYVSQFVPDRALPFKWPLYGADCIEICVKMASQFLLKLRPIYKAIYTAKH